MFTPWNAEHIPLGPSLFKWDLTPLILHKKVDSTLGEVVMNILAFRVSELSYMEQEELYDSIR